MKQFTIIFSFLTTLITSCAGNIEQNHTAKNELVFAKNSMLECRYIFDRNTETINKWKGEIENKSGLLWVEYSFHSGAYNAIALLKLPSSYEIVDLISDERANIEYSKYREITKGLTFLPKIESEIGEKLDGGCHYLYIIDDSLPVGEFIFDSAAIDKYENKSFFDLFLDFVRNFQNMEQ